MTCAKLVTWLNSRAAYKWPLKTSQNIYFEGHVAGTTDFIKNCTKTVFICVCENTDLYDYVLFSSGERNRVLSVLDLIVNHRTIRAL